MLELLKNTSRRFTLRAVTFAFALGAATGCADDDGGTDAADTSTDLADDASEAGPDGGETGGGARPDGPATPSGAVALQIGLDAPIAEVDPRYLSFAIDASQWVGGTFWGEASGSSGGLGEQDIDPFDFDRARLRELTAPLAPAMLRLGGSEADKVYVDLGDDPLDEAPEPYSEVLTRAMWEGVLEFVDAVEFDLFVTVNAGPGPRDGRAWTPDNVRPLVEAANAADAPVVVWELGNEINGYPLLHGLDWGLSAAEYTADLDALHALLDEVGAPGRVAGPSSAIWPITGEINAFMPSFMPAGGDRLDVLTWHFYPTLSERCPVRPREAELRTLLDPANLAEIDRWAEYVETLAAAHAPDAELWLGETGNAYCGGQSGVSDRFVGSLWWVDQLGRIARRGHRVMIRQTLAGSDYGLLDAETLEPRPDYFASVFWKKAMGTTVLEVAHAGPDTLTAYAHCDAGGQGVALALVNVDEHRAVTVAVPGAWQSAAWIVDAASLDAEQIRVNGEVPAVDAADLDAAPIVENEEGSWLEVPPAGYAVVRLHDVPGAAACAGE